MTQRWIRIDSGHRMRTATAAQILPLRARVLRPDRPVETAKFEEDNFITTHHFGIFKTCPIARPVCCASFLLEAAAWHLRGMATEPEYKGQGYGQKLLLWAEGLLVQSGVKTLRCDAPTTAIGFYESCGWNCTSNEFNMEDLGPHRSMMKYY